MYRERLTLGSALALAGIFLYLLHAAPGGGLAAVDDLLLASLRELRGPRLNQAFLELTALGSVTVLSLLAIFFVALALLDGRRRPALQLALAAILTSSLTHLIKHFAARPRPPLALRLDLATGFSFPSGHASSGSAIYLTLALLLFPHFSRSRAQACFLGCAVAFVLCLGISRAYLAVHYPSDVLAGLCLGSGIALLAHLALNPRSAWHLRRRR
jgi:undecaprenyl-diphosphatase